MNDTGDLIIKLSSICFISIISFSKGPPVDQAWLLGLQSCRALSPACDAVRHPTPPRPAPLDQGFGQELIGKEAEEALMAESLYIHFEEDDPGAQRVASSMDPDEEDDAYDPEYEMDLDLVARVMDSLKGRAGSPGAFSGGLAGAGAGGGDAASDAVQIDADDDPGGGREGGRETEQPQKRGSMGWTFGGYKVDPNDPRGG